MKPLLAIDGDSLAHRAYHALPKTFRRAEGRPGNMLLGFANMLVRLWETEQPAAVLVGWDTLGTPTYRHEAFPGYQAGRVFEPDLLEQLELMPALVESFGFAIAKARTIANYLGDDFVVDSSVGHIRDLPTKAADILREYGSLEAALEAGRFSAQAEELRLYRRMATLDASAPLPPLTAQVPSWAEASAHADALGLGQLAGRLASRA